MFGIIKYYDADWGAAGSGALSGAGMGASIGSVVPGVGTAIGAAAGGLIGGITGLFQKKKGNQLLKNNPYPNQPVPNEVLANQQVAQNMANEGTPSQQYQNAQKNIQRQQSTAVSAAQDRRLGGALIPTIQQATNDAAGNVEAQSSVTRRENQLNLQNVNNQVAGWRNQAWDWNQKQKYLQNYQYGQSLVGVGNQNIMAGADKILGGLVGGYANGLFSGRGGSNQTTSSTPVNQFGQPSYSNGQYND